MRRYKVAIKASSGISSAMRNYCNECGISVWKFLCATVEERLRKPLNFSIAEIEQMQIRKYEKNTEFEIFEFGISDAIMQEKLRMIKDDYGISLNKFFVKIIAEKLNECGCSFDDKSLKNPVRKEIIKRKPKTIAEKDAESIKDLCDALWKIQMRRK